jgi:hypothetical protein
MVTIAFVSGCSYNIHNVTTPDPATLLKKEAINGVTVAVDPLFPAAKSEAVFNTNLAKDGILAVQVVLSNNSLAERFVSTESVWVAHKDGTKWLPVEAGEAAKSAHTSPVLTGFATGVPMFFVFFSGVLIGPAVAYQTAKMNENITADFRAKEFKDRKLLVGETYGGFLFFRKPGDSKEITTIDGLKVEAQVENLSTKQKLTATIGL